MLVLALDRAVDRGRDGQQHPLRPEPLQAVGLGARQLADPLHECAVAPSDVRADVGVGRGGEAVEQEREPVAPGEHRAERLGHRVQHGVGAGGRRGAELVLDPAIRDL